MNVIEQFVKHLRSAAVFNPEIQVAPVCILWPDRDRQWEAVIPLLQDALPELFVLGEYDPAKRTGPAIWLRCVLADCLEERAVPEGLTPIFYLPGVGRQDLRAVNSCPKALTPLVELQYRGTIWSQVNAKDWTPLAYLHSDQGGLGLDLAQDKETKRALQLALSRFLEEDLALVREKRLDKDYFNTLLTGGDPIRNVLLWLDQGERFASRHSESEWKAFTEICQSQFDFDPQAEGCLAGAEALARHEGPWKAVWERYCEAPGRYPDIPARIKKCRTPREDARWAAGDVMFAGWPQWNEAQENSLRSALLALASLPAHKARETVKNLEAQHGRRRSLVWTELGQSSLACILEHLAVLADSTRRSLAAGSLADMESVYRRYGWKADDAVLRALAQVNRQADVAAVTAAVRAVYLPWLEESARYLQNLVESSEYPGGTYLTQHTSSFHSGDCILFVDGLRFDAARRLAASLQKQGIEVAEKISWAALPSVTATGKAAVSPVRDKIRGENGSTDFEPSVAATGQSLKGGYHLKKLLSDAGWTILDRTDYGDGKGMAWCEFGDIDHEGHDRGWKLAKHLDGILQEVVEYSKELLTAGWKRIHVVTDHGWLLLPDGLPKRDLPGALTENKWGRCATLKHGASVQERRYSWYWNPDQDIVLADGVSCFKKGEEYAHGGLSLQECLRLTLTISKSGTNQKISPPLVRDIAWKGLRCTVTAEGDLSGLRLDIRKQAGRAQTSIVVTDKTFKDNGTASVVVEDDDLEGALATVVLIDAQGELIVRRDTVIGGGKA